MIRTVALGFICLAGVGAIAAAAKKSTPPPLEVVMPVVSGNKTDRLPLTINEDKSTEAKTERRRVSSTKQTKTRSVDPPPAQISELKECRSDGLDPLLRKLNLSPPCN